MTTTYVVTAPLVIAKSEQGADLYVYQGAPVPDGQSDEWIATHKDTDMIAEAPADAGDDGAEKPARKARAGS